MEIVALENKYLEDVRVFTDRWIGRGYYELAELEELLELGQINSTQSSFMAFIDGELAAVRLCFAPGNLRGVKGRLSPELWKTDQKHVGYFKSLFVADKFQGLGLGPKLSQKSLEVMKSMGGRAVLCHSWLESPNNSSYRYLKKQGFSDVCEYKNYWIEVDYLCTRCTPSRCTCSAMEMIKTIYVK